MKEYLLKNNFEKYLHKLKKKLKNKSIVIYGSGVLFQYIQENFDLSALNIIGISDMKFLPEQEGEDFLGYKIIPKSKLKEYAPDVILVATLYYIEIIEDFEINIFPDPKTQIYPLVKKNFWDLIKEIWER